MKHSCSRPPAPSPLTSISMEAVWNVQADSSYDVIRNAVHPPNLIAVRTMGGTGRIYLGNRTLFDVSKDTLLFLENNKITRYHWTSAAWQFWWFEFTVSGPLQFPLSKLISTPENSLDKADFRLLFSGIRNHSAAKRLYASSLFLVMLNRWLATADNVLRAKPHQQKIERIMEEMHGNTHARWTISEMATEAGMSERSFRQAFEQIAGQSPKKFYDRLRLEAAAEILKLGLHSVGEVSEQFSFSSQFHFSKAFRRHFGMPPSGLTRTDSSGR